MTGDEKTRRSAARIILIDGLLVRGGFFALGMFVARFFIDWVFGNGTSFVDYVSSPATWSYFVFSLLVFGLFVGLYGWFRQKGSAVGQSKTT